MTITVEKMIARLQKYDKRIEIEETSFNQLLAEVEKNKFSPLLAMSYEDFFAWGYKPTWDGGCYTYATEKNTDSPESRLSYLEYLMSKRNSWEGADEELESVANVSYYCSNCENGGVWDLQTESMVCKDCGSGLNGLYQDKLDEFQDFQKEFSIYKQSTDELQFNLQNRSDLIPSFNLNRTKSRIFSNEDKLIVEIYLTNVGRGTANRIMTCPVYNDLSGHPIYFDQSPSSGKATHAFYNYFSENFAIPNESISFSLCEIEQQTQQLYFLIFKIRFSDTLGREYEQEFKFGYDNYLVKGINQDSISYPPKLIKDIN